MTSLLRLVFHVEQPDLNVIAPFTLREVRPPGVGWPGQAPAVHPVSSLVFHVEQSDLTSLPASPFSPLSRPQNVFFPHQISPCPPLGKLILLTSLIPP
jgi:hypothetical protein